MSQQHWIYGYHALKMAIQTHPGDLTQVYLQSGRNDKRAQEIRQLAQSCGLSVSVMPLKSLNQLLTESKVHQGMLASSNRELCFSEHDLATILASESQALLLILDGIQDPHNLGACLRSANAFDVCAVIAPKDRAVGITPTVKKVACGAAELTPFIQVTNLARTMRWLQQQGIWLVGTDDQSQDNISQLDLTGPIAMVMGNEGRGMRRLVREHCDFLARIELLGDVSSVNVSVATGICLYEVQRQRNLGCN